MIMKWKSFALQKEAQKRRARRKELLESKNKEESQSLLAEDGNEEA